MRLGPPSLTVMAPETLVTFLFECPVRARTVELLGSWDNFTKPYHLQRDRRRGHCIWSGCYTFQDIICDGDLSNIGRKRSGALKMGGTYWYYYKVDDEEAHNPSEPTTTSCPLLPGQKLNVLEVPMESRSRRGSEVSGTFTRNPQDRFLTPVPPKAISSPRLGDLCKEAHTVPMQPRSAPRSATLPLPSTSRLSTDVPNRHARSASTSPQMSSTAIFCDFKGLKEKFAQKRSAHSRSISARDLEIGAPTLVSTTAEEMNLVPLAALQPSPTSPYNITAQPLPSPATPATAQLRQFSPLRSHPVHNVDIAPPEAEAQHLTRPRSRSHTAETTTQQIMPKAILNREQSADTRRSPLFPGEPWITSPSPSQPQKHEIPPTFMLSSAPAPVLRKPRGSLDVSNTNARPSSSHGGDRSPGLRKAPVDKDKKLPPLPRFLVPAPLFACNSGASSPVPTLEPEPGPESEPEKEQANMEREEESPKAESAASRPAQWNSHFSLWSSHSLSSGSSPTVDDNTVNSPTLTALTSDFSDFESPKRLSGRFSVDSYSSSSDRKSAAGWQHGNGQARESTSSQLSELPQVDSIRLSSFGPGLFLDIQYEESGPRRQAACYGYGFQAYKLPEDESDSKITLTQSTMQSEPQIQHDRGNSTSQFEKLMDEFGFLGESVV